MNYQTKNKINDLKEMIKNKVELKVIIKEKFAATPSRKNKWLGDNSHHFTEDELNYLEYQPIIDTLEIENEPIINTLSNSFLTTNINTLTVQEKTNLILSSDFLDILQRMANDYLSNSIQSKKDLVIPQEYFNLKDISIKNCRISNKIYNDFINLAKSKNITITALLNYVLSDFVEKNK